MDIEKLKKQIEFDIEKYERERKHSSTDVGKAWYGGKIESLRNILYDLSKK